MSKDMHKVKQLKTGQVRLGVESRADEPITLMFIAL